MSCVGFLAGADGPCSVRLERRDLVDVVDAVVGRPVRVVLVEVADPVSFHADEDNRCFFERAFAGARPVHDPPDQTVAVVVAGGMRCASRLRR